MGVDARGFPGGLLRLDPAFAYVEPPSSWPLSWVELLTLAPGSDRIPVELFQILKDDAVESAVLNMQICTQYAICRLPASNQGFPRTLKSFPSNLQSTANFHVDKTNRQKWWQIGVSVRNKWLFWVMYLNIGNSFQLLSIIILRTKKQSNWKMGRRPKQTLLQWRHTGGQQAHEKIFNFINY